MAVQRIDNTAIVFEDLDAAVAFFTELGLELEGRQFVEGQVVDDCVGMPNVRTEIAMMRAPGGAGARLELTRYDRPAAIPAPPPAPNSVGFHRVMFAVDDLNEVLGRLQKLGAELIGKVGQYEDTFRLCYLRGPEGIVVALAQELH